jgi:glutamate 5-kinase
MSTAEGGGVSARALIAAAKTVVVKVGSSLVTAGGTGLDEAEIGRWAHQVAQLRTIGKRVVLVSSGAIAEGMMRLGWTSRPHAMHALQAAAAVGQMGLAQAYESCFRRHSLRTAQVLLTHADLADRERYLNARSTIRTLLDLDVVPVINENDTVVTDEIKFGDNDTLAALVTNLIEADALVILTDQAGVYSADPRTDSQAQLIAEGIAGDPYLEGIAGGTGSPIAKGGMMTKILAAKRAARSGAHTVIAAGREADVLLRIMRGEPVGTALAATTPSLAARKQWLADHLQVAGTLTLDAGAARALRQGGKSLLPVGVTAVSGDFARGALVLCKGPEGTEIARGLVNYGSAEARRILGQPSSAIETILGYVDEPELIHRDNMVLLFRAGGGH